MRGTSCALKPRPGRRAKSFSSESCHRETGFAPGRIPPARDSGLAILTACSASCAANGCACPKSTRAQASARRVRREVAPGTCVLLKRNKPRAHRSRQRRRSAMNRHLFTLRVTVQDGERAILTRNGRFEQVLEPGRHTAFDPLRETAAEVHNVVRAEFSAERYAVLKAARPDVAAALFEAVETRADEIAIVSLDGRPLHLMGPWQVRVFWKVATRVEVERVDVTTDRKVAQRHLAMGGREGHAYVAE